MPALTLVRQFQKEARTVLTDEWFQRLSEEDQRAFLYTGLGSEAGEVQEIYKKDIAGEPIDRNHLIEELGDVLWHIAVVAAIEGIELEEILYKSMRKFRTRYPHRFTEGAEE